MPLKVWGLYESGWAIVKDNEGNRLIPFWAIREFAEVCVVQDWKMYSPKTISLDIFMEKWIPGMEKDKIKVSCSMTPDGQDVNVEPMRLLRGCILHLSPEGAVQRAAKYAAVATPYAHDELLNSAFHRLIHIFNVNVDFVS